jgi:hypothetical protein
MGNTSRYCRTADQRRWGATGTGVGIAVGGAMAAGVSMGTASADDLLAPATADDPFTELVQAIDPNAFAAAAVPAQAAEDAFEQLVEAIDGNAFTSTGAPNADFRVAGSAQPPIVVVGV